MLISNSPSAARSTTSVARAAGSPLGSAGKVCSVSVWRCSGISVSLCCRGRFGGPWGTCARRLCDARAGCDLLGYECGVVPDEAEQRGTAGVLPLQAEHVQPGHLGHAAAVLDTAVEIGEWQVDPAVVAGEPAGPDDALDRQRLAAI